MISPTWHSPGCGWLHRRGTATGLFGSLFVSLLGEESEKERERVKRTRREEEEGVCFLSEQLDEGGCSEQIISFR